MATVNRLGTYTVHQGQSDGSFSVTVPADADICIVITSGYRGSSGALLDELNWDDGSALDFTLINTSYYSSGPADPQLTAHYMVDTDGNWPGSGSQTLYFANPGNYVEGYVLVALFYENIDASDPVIESENQEGVSGDDWTSAFTESTSESMTVCASYQYGGGGTDQVMDNNGQTEIYATTSAYNDAHLSIGEKLNEDEFEVENPDGNPPFVLPLAFILRPSAAGVSKEADDTGGGADSIATLLSSLALSDTGGGADSIATLLSSLTLSDTGESADSIATLLSSLALSDTGTAADNIATLLSSLVLSDTGAGSDALVLDVGAIIKEADDTGGGVESVDTLTSLLLTLSSAQGVDTISLLSPSTSVEGGAGSDTVGIANALVVTDNSGVTVDALSALIADILLSESGSSADAIGLINSVLYAGEVGAGSEDLATFTGSVTHTDTAEASEIITTLQAELAASEQATASGVAIVYVGGAMAVFTYGPVATNRSNEGFNTAQTINQDGTVYGIVLADSASAPTNLDIKNARTTTIGTGDLLEHTDSANLESIGQAGTDAKHGQSFTTPASLTQIDSIALTLLEVGDVSAKGSMYVELWTDDAGDPGTLLDNGVSDPVLSSVLTDTLTYHTFTFTNKPELAASTSYFIVFYLGWDADPQDYVRQGSANSKTSYTGGDPTHFNGTIWLPFSAGDFDFKVNYHEITYGSPIDSDNVAATATVKNTLFYTGLTPDTPYDVYTIAESSTGLMVNPAKNDISTLGGGANLGEENLGQDGLGTADLGNYGLGD